MKKRKSISPFRRYRIYLEQEIAPKERIEVIADLHGNGWIHPNAENVKPTSDGGFFELACTPDLMGKIVGSLTYRFGHVTVLEII